MKKFVIKPLMGEVVEELAAITLPSCCKAYTEANNIVINVPNGTTTALAKAFEDMLIDGYTCHWSSCENKVVLGAMAPTCVKLISTNVGQEILYTRVSSGINGFQVVIPETPSRTVLRTTPKREN